MQIHGMDDKDRMVITLKPGMTYVFECPDDNGTRHQILSHSPRDGRRVIMRCDDLFDANTSTQGPLDIS